MKTRLTAKLIFSMILLLVATLVARATADDVWSVVFPPLDWKQQDFRDRFLGRYGVNAYTEPQLDLENYTFYEGVLAVADDKEKAVDYLQKALEKMKTQKVEPSAALYFLLGSLQHELGRKEEAIAAYLRAIKLYPSYLRAYANLGFALMETGEPDQALPVLIRAVELGAHEAQIHGLIGTLYLEKKLFHSALTSFQWALVLAPRANTWRQGMFRALIGLEHFSEALGVGEELLAFDRKAAQHWSNLGNLHLQLGHEDEAIVHFEAAWQLGAKSHRLALALAGLYFNKQVYVQGREALFQAADLAADATQLDNALRFGRPLCRMGMSADAAELLARLRRRAGDISAELDWVETGLVELHQRFAARDFSAALDGARLLVKEQPMLADAQLLVARSLDALTLLPEAEAAYEVAALIPDAAYDARIEHAQLKLRLGKTEDALRLLRGAHEIKPSAKLLEHIEDLASAARKRQE